MWVRGLPFVGSGSTLCGFEVCPLWVRGLPLLALLWVQDLPFVGSGFALYRFMMGLKAPKGSRPGFDPKRQTRWTF